MSVQSQVLIAAKQAENAQTTQYTSTNARTIIDKFIACNTSGGAVTLSINLVTAADTAGNQNLFVKTKSLAASETYTFPEIVGFTMNSGGFISTIASAATSISITASGRVIT